MKGKKYKYSDNITLEVFWIIYGITSIISLIVHNNKTGKYSKYERRLKDIRTDKESFIYNNKIIYIKDFK